eukprot:111987_1
MAEQGNWKKSKIGADAKSEIKKSNASREGRWADWFDHFRKNVWVRQGSRYEKLLSHNVDMDLAKWMIHTAHHTKECTMVAFFRIMSKKLKLHHLEDEKEEGLDRIIVDCSNVEMDKKALKSVIFTKKTLKSYMSVVLNSSNRILERYCDETKALHCNDQNVESWVIDPLLYFKVNLTQWSLLRNERKHLLTLSAWVHGKSSAKAKPMRTQELDYLVAKLPRYYPSNWPRNDSWDPDSLNKAKMILDLLHDAGRSAKEKRMKNFPEIYQDTRGYYTELYEADGTKIHGISEENDKALQMNRLYQRDDCMGITSLMISERELRPRQSDVDPGAVLVTALWLKPLACVKYRKDGSRLGYANVPLGHTSIAGLFTCILVENGLPLRTLYSMRFAVPRSMVKKGHSVLDAMNNTKHITLSSIVGYVEDQDKEERRTEVIAKYANQMITQNQNIRLRCGGQRHLAIQNPVMAARDCLPSPAVIPGRSYSELQKDIAMNAIGSDYARCHNVPCGTVIVDENWRKHVLADLAREEAQRKKQEYEKAQKEMRERARQMYVMNQIRLINDNQPRQHPPRNAQITLPIAQQMIVNRPQQQQLNLPNLSYSQSSYQRGYPYASRASTMINRFDLNDAKPSANRGGYNAHRGQTQNAFDYANNGNDRNVNRNPFQ